MLLEMENLRRGKDVLVLFPGPGEKGVWEEGEEMLTK